MPETLLLKGDDVGVALAGRLLREGGLVAIPTETVYGLAANARDPKAVDNIFRVKGRPQDNPLIVHVASAEALPELVSELPDEALRLTGTFWPGPLTLVLPRSGLVPDNVTAGLDTVAVRCPDNEIARRVILEAGTPLAAPSANLSGRPSPTAARHVMDDLGGRIKLILDGGPCAVGLESTVLDVMNRCILRPGGVTKEQIEAVIGPLDGAHKTDETAVPRSPGMKYRHYAPDAPVVILEGALDKAAAYVRERSRGERIGVLCFDGEAEAFDRASAVISYGGEFDAVAQSRRLFSALRELDGAGVGLICARCPENTGMFSAVANRLHKAAGSVIRL